MPGVSSDSGPSDFLTAAKQRGEEDDPDCSFFTVVIRLGLTAYGAQKLFGCFGGGRVNGIGTYGKVSNDFGLF